MSRRKSKDISRKELIEMIARLRATVYAWQWDKSEDIWTETTDILNQTTFDIEEEDENN